ncbi:MAG: TIR domain-containing protein [Alphaproteobacteria bacterium]
MTYERTYDLFITHAWRYHDDWTRMGELLDAAPGLVWRNFSLPWHDPAMDANTEIGGRFIRQWLESQIVPANGIIFLAGVYEVNSTRKWLDLELELAHKHGKPSIAVPKSSGGEIPPDVAERVSATCPWDAVTIIATLDRLGGRADA